MTSSNFVVLVSMRYEQIDKVLSILELVTSNTSGKTAHGVIRLQNRIPVPVPVNTTTDTGGPVQYCFVVLLLLVVEGKAYRCGQKYSHC